MRKRGFTLIELLVVIAIIAILAAILFPVFAKARAKARQTACLNNEKQLILSFLQYAEDWEGTMPDTWRGNYNNEPWCWDNNNDLQTDGRQNWAQAILPYNRNAEIYQCPSAGIRNWQVPDPGDHSCSYICNDDLDVKLGQIQNPAQIVLLWEDFRFHDVAATAYWDKGNSGGNYGNGPGFPHNYQDWGGGSDYKDFTHNHGSNCAFMDGHCKWLESDHAFANQRLYTDPTFTGNTAGDRDHP